MASEPNKLTSPVKVQSRMVDSFPCKFHRETPLVATPNMVKSASRFPASIDAAQKDALLLRCEKGFKDTTASSLSKNELGVETQIPKT